MHVLVLIGSKSSSATLVVQEDVVLFLRSLRYRKIQRYPSDGEVCFHPELILLRVTEEVNGGERMSMAGLKLWS